jgi:hypothetical protein
LLEPRVLILHQRDQRGDHHHHPFEKQRRQLITQRFSGSRRQDSQRIPARQSRRHQLALAWAEALEPETPFRDVLQLTPAEAFSRIQVTFRHRLATPSRFRARDWFAPGGSRTPAWRSCDPAEAAERGERPR